MEPLIQFSTTREGRDIRTDFHVRDEDVAYTIHRDMGDVYKLKVIFVKPAFRGIGVGRTALVTLIVIYDDKPIELLARPFPDTNGLTLDQLIKFYKRFGFQPTQDRGKKGVRMSSRPFPRRLEFDLNAGFHMRSATGVLSVSHSVRHKFSTSRFTPVIAGDEYFPVYGTPQISFAFDDAPAKSYQEKEFWKVFCEKCNPEALKIYQKVRAATTKTRRQRRRNRHRNQLKRYAKFDYTKQGE